MTEPSREAIPLNYRTVLTMHPEADGSRIAVDHVYAPEGAFDCDDCGEPGHDPGMVGLTMAGDDNQNASALLTAEEALVLANRLQRAASLVMESEEDTPDVEREAARFSAPARPQTIASLAGAGALSVSAEDVELAKRAAMSAVWDAWGTVADDEPSPVKRIARDLHMSTNDVAAIVYPVDKFSTWDDSQEPDLP